MLGNSEEILADIDRTLDQMIKNAVALRQIAEYEAFTADCATMHKMQHSLTGRVLHMQELLQMLGHECSGDEQILCEKMQEKIRLYKTLNNRMIDTIAERFAVAERQNPIKKKPRIGHNRRRNPVKVPLKPV